MNVEISDVIDEIFDIINKIDSNINITDEQNKLLDKYKQKYTSNLYISCISNYYKIKIYTFGENIKYEFFLDQIINFIQNIKIIIEMLTKDINLFNIIIDIIVKTIYEKIIKINIKNLSEIKESKLSLKINLINKLCKIESELKNIFPENKLEFKNIFKPVDNLLFTELKEKIKIMEKSQIDSWTLNGSKNYYDILETYLELIKNMRELNELSKMIYYISIKDKILIKICWFYTKYLEQIDIESITNNLTNLFDLTKSFIYINTLYKMIDDLDGLNVSLEIRENTIKVIQDKINNYEKNIFNFISGQIKKIFKSSITEIIKDFFTIETQVKIYDVVEKFIKKDCLTNKSIAFDYYKKSNQMVCKEILTYFLLNLDTYSKQKINQFVSWFNEIKLELVNQIRENIQEDQYPDKNLIKWIDLVYEKTNLIIYYLDLDSEKISNTDGVNEIHFKEKFISIFGSDKEYNQLYKYKFNKFNKFNPVNKVLAGGTKIINSVGNDITTISSGVVSITKNSINSVNNISSNITNVNLFEKRK